MPGVTDPAEEYFKDGLWGWVTSAWEKLVADASGFLKINFAAQDVDVEVTQTAAADLTPGVCGWDGAAWRKLPMVWGYSERWAEDLSIVKVGAGEFIGNTALVPEGYVYVVKFIYIRNNTGARGRVLFSLLGDAVWYYLLYAATPAALVPDTFVGDLTLKEDDRVRIQMLTCLNNDDIEAGVWGYKMKIAE